MADKYVTLFDTLYGGAKWDVGVAINRSNALPLDRNSIFPSYELARAYAAMDEAAMTTELTNLGLKDVKINNNAYAGQVLAVVTSTETTIYYIDANKELQEVGGKVGVDGKSIVSDEDGNLYIGGFDSAEALTLPQKQADGSIKWVPISSIVEGDGNTKTYISAADKTVEVTKFEDSEEKISYTVKVNVSDAEGNCLVLDENGLYVPTPEEYDDSEVRELIDSKADASALNNYYTKGEVDDAIDADVKVVGDKVATLEEQIKGLSGAMHFKGVLEALPSTTEGYDDGDVIVVGEKEYVCNGNLWVLFGDVNAEGQRLTALETAVNTTIPANYALKSEIPTKVSELSNDAEYITKEVNNLTNYDTTSVVEGKIEDAIKELKIEDYAKSADVEELLKEKQDVIEDLVAIREGAGKGATALQSDAIADMLTKTEAQGIYETIENVNAVKGRVEALEGGISSKQEQVIAGDGIALGEDNKTISANIGDGLKFVNGQILIDDEVIASQSEFNALDGRVGDIEAELPEIKASLESLGDSLSKDEAADTYLPLTGGSLTGDVKLTSGANITADFGSGITVDLLGIRNGAATLGANARTAVNGSSIMIQTEGETPSPDSERGDITLDAHEVKINTDQRLILNTRDIKTDATGIYFHPETGIPSMAVEYDNIIIHQPLSVVPNGNIYMSTGNEGEMWFATNYLDINASRNINGEWVTENIIKHSDGVTTVGYSKSTSVEIQGTEINLTSELKPTWNSKPLLVEDDILVQSVNEDEFVVTEGKLSINKVNVNQIVQDENDVLYLDCGAAE